MPAAGSGEVGREGPHREPAPGWAGGGAEQPPPATSLPAAMLGSGCPVRCLAPPPQAASDTGTAASCSSTVAEVLDTGMMLETSGTSSGTEESDSSSISVASSSSLSEAAANLFLPDLHSRWDHRPIFPEHRNPHLAAGPDVLAPFISPPPARQLFSLGVLQIVLGCSVMLLDFGMLSLSSVPQVKNSCLFWAGSAAIISGILTVTSKMKPMTVLANVFIMMNIVCVLLNLVGFIMGCQGIHFVTNISRCDVEDMGEDKICFCCEELHLTSCSEGETVLKLYHVGSCTTSHLLLKKVLFSLCAMSALTTIVCLVATVLHCLQNFAARRSCANESRVEGRDQALERDFTPPVPSPSYGATCYNSTPTMNSRMLGSNMIPLSHIYGTQIKGIEVFCFLDPPPPYEAVEEGEQRVSVIEDHDGGEESDRQASPGEKIPESSSRVSLSPSDASLVPAEAAGRKAFNPLWKRSLSDTVVHCRLLEGAVLMHEAAMKTEVKLQLWPDTLEKSLRARALRGRSQSLTKYKPSTGIKDPVAWMLEQSSCSMSPDIYKSVENYVKSILELDENHIAEATANATFLEQVTTPVQQAMLPSSACVLPFRYHSGLLHLESCGDLSTFTTGEGQLVEWLIQGAEHKGPHSPTQAVRETEF